MWVFVHFDLPTDTKKDRKNYAKFRKYLLEDGFTMIQYSMYARHCSSRENAEVHKKRVKINLPPLGQVIVFEITDAQFGRLEFFSGKKPKENTNQPKQLELF
ncbi:MAG: CRISPR-associated endonuclease Cas2 [Saprospiraceae bacterium]|jgi:CRISPR-associated protein Cas2